MADKQVVLITGANTGIGYETAKALLASQTTTYHIYVSSRNLTKVETAIQELSTLIRPNTHSLSPLELDVTSNTSINDAYTTVATSHSHIDVLINNAGAAFDGQHLTGKLGQRETWNKSYDVNVSGTQVVSHMFAPLLLASSSPRLLFITSGLSICSTARAGWVAEASRTCHGGVSIVQDGVEYANVGLGVEAKGGRR